MALLVLIVVDMKCSCLSVLLVYATRHTANCVALAILLGTCQLVNDVPAEVKPASVFAHPCKFLYTKPMLIRNSSVTRQSYRTVLHFRHRVTYMFWLDRESSYKRLSQLALDPVASPASQAYVERL